MPKKCTGLPAAVSSKPPKWTRVGDATLGYHAYDNMGDQFEVKLGACEQLVPGNAECVEGRRDADSTAAFFNSTISITPVTWDRSYGTAIDGEKEMKDIQKYVAEHAPKS